EEAFRAGLVDFQVVQNTIQALNGARIGLLTEQFNYLNYLIDLEYSLGIPFGTLSGNGSMQ
ncbi:MAG: TolC family protein, partial [Treponema sp.]|nr:TolC family protein [Treponema sp.]